MNINLGLGIGVFQGFLNVVLNGKFSLYLYYLLIEV